MSEENQNSEEEKIPTEGQEKSVGKKEEVTPEAKVPEKEVAKAEAVKKEVSVKKEVKPKEEIVEEPKVFSPERKALIDEISSWMDDLEFTEENTEFLTVICNPTQLHSLATNLKNNSKTLFDYMFCLSGVDYPEHMQVVYHLKSTTLKHEIVLKVKIEDRENPVVDSLSDLWQTAELHEREAFDFYGIKFTNHPDLRRLFLTDDWVGYPMRKDYVDEVNIVSL